MHKEKRMSWSQCFMVSDDIILYMIVVKESATKHFSAGVSLSDRVDVGYKDELELVVACWHTSVIYQRDTNIKILTETN